MNETTHTPAPDVAEVPALDIPEFLRREGVTVVEGTDEILYVQTAEDVGTEEPTIH